MKTKDLAMTAVMAALMCIAAMALRWVSPALVPFSILPILVFLSGLILGAQYGALAMIVYILLGLFGLPVFASAPFAGFVYVLKPTFGYLIGYIAAAYLIGLIYRRGHIGWAAAAVAVGFVVLYFFGVTYLYIILNWYMHKPTTVGMAIAIGFTPFFVSDLLKAAIAVWLGNEVVKRRSLAVAR